jgi:transcriptional regulator with XRE-family HTH domain
MENRRRSSRQEWVEFSRLLGLRLRELRKHAGLTQTQVAKFLGKPGPGGKSWVCQLEKGNLREVSINNVVEFVWACGADPGEILDVVNGYVKRPPIPEERVRQQVADVAVDLPLSKRARVEHYDLLHGPKTGRRETPEQQRERRVREATGQARAIRWERRLRRVHNDVLNELRVACGDPLAIHLGAYGRKVFGALRRTRRARPVWRQKAMAKLDTWADEHGLPPEPFARMRQAVIALFADMERKGELD